MTNDFRHAHQAGGSNAHAIHKTISIPGALRLLGVMAGVWAVLVAAATTLAYLPEHSEFSLA